MTGSDSLALPTQSLPETQRSLWGCTSRGAEESMQDISELLEEQVPLVLKMELKKVFKLLKVCHLGKELDSF